MKQPFGPALGAVVAVLAACAASGTTTDDTPATPAPTSEDGGAPSIIDGSSGAAEAAPPDADVFAPQCSPAGWCTTPLPMNSGFTFTDVWPLGQTAFATGVPTGDPSRGAIAEYDGEAWALISPLYDARLVWAPSADEVWAGGSSYRGTPALKRGIRSSGTWTWSSMLPAETNMFGLWGSGPGDVYALSSDNQGAFGHRVYHFDATGVPALVFEADRPSNTNSTLRIERIVGTAPDDVWILGRRQQCGFLAHKSDGAFVTVANAMLSPDGRCTDTGEVLHWQDIPSIQWVGAVAPARGVIDILVSGDKSPAGGRVTRVNVTPDGFEITKGATFGYASTNWIAKPTSVWSPAPGDLFVAGFGVVLRNPTAFDDAGSFSYSNLLMGGSFIGKQFNSIRGTATNDIWIVGDSYALHKTTP